MRGPDSARARDAIAKPSIGNLVVALVVAVLLAGVANLAVMSKPSVYSSSSVLLLDQPTEVALGNDGVVVKLSLLRYKYAAILTTDLVMKPVSETVDLPLEVVRSSQRLTLAPNTFTITLAAVSGNREQARRIAHASARALSDYVRDEQASTTLSETQQLSLRVVQDAGVATKISPERSRGRQAAAVAGGAGLMLVYVGLQLLSANRRLS